MGETHALIWDLLGLVVPGGSAGVILVATLLGCLTSMAATRLMCRLAPRWGLVDHPDKYRKTHGRSVALGGGLAIFVAFLVTLAVIRGLMPPEMFAGKRNWSMVLPLIIAGTVIVLVGLWDDRFHLRGRQKLLGQTIAALIVIFGGLQITQFSIFGYVAQLGIFWLPFTLFWFLGAINSLNLLDGMDGLATTVGLIIVATVGVMAGLDGRVELAVIAFAFAGALLGFLRYNFPPARIFLGDAGSMLIGLVVGAISIEASLKGPGTVLLAAPVAIWTIPIMDTALAIVRRKLTGRSIYCVDRAHLHHQLLDRLGSDRKALLVAAALCLVTCVAALVSVAVASDLPAWLSACAIVAICVVCDIFGRPELHLLASRVHRFVVSLVPSTGPKPYDGKVCIQGDNSWDELWGGVTAAAEKHGWECIELTLNVPQIHEAFHAVWQRNGRPTTDKSWQVRVDLVVDDNPVGNLHAIGLRNGEPTTNPLNLVGQLAGQIENHVAQLLEQGLAVRVPLSEKASEHSSTDEITRRKPR